MVYKGFDVGSAKPKKETLKKYPHKLVDIITAETNQNNESKDINVEVLNEVQEQEANNDTQLDPIDSKETTSDSQDDEELPENDGEKK